MKLLPSSTVRATAKVEAICTFLEFMSVLVVIMGSVLWKVSSGLNFVIVKLNLI